jgi:hypothetical protein
VRETRKDTCVLEVVVADEVDVDVELDEDVVGAFV